MGNNKKPDNKSRRQFFSLFAGKDKSAKPEMVKMLTRDGKLVEVEKSVFEAATNRQKATKQDIYNWMKNPSKDSNS